MAILCLIYVYAFVIGICIASFMNVVVYRVPNNLNFVKGRSFCPKCEHTLHAKDLVPLFSWLLLKGKCRYCGAPISKRYPLVELCGGLIALFVFHHYGFSWETLLVFSLGMILMVISLVDNDTMEIPNGFIIVCLIIACLSLICGTQLPWSSRIIGFFVVSVPMCLLNLIIPDSFGGGDIKLMAVCGLMLGWVNILLAMFIGVILAGTYAIYLILSKKIEKKDISHLVLIYVLEFLWRICMDRF